jgi:hypothetical protein
MASESIVEARNTVHLEVLQLCRSGRISWADMVLAPSVAGLFKWRKFEPEVILLATIDFLLSAKRDAATAERFLAKALGGANHPHPRVINTDEHAAYPPVIVQLKAEGALEENCGHRPVQYLNNVLEQDHRAIKRRVRASQHFRSFWGAWRTIAGYEAMHMIRKGQARCSAAGAKVCLLHRFILALFAAT